MGFIISGFTILLKSKSLTHFSAFTESLVVFIWSIVNSLVSGLYSYLFNLSSKTPLNPK